MLGTGLYNLPVCHHTFAHIFFFPPKLLFAARQCSWVKAAAGWGQGGLPSARQQVGWGGKGGAVHRLFSVEGWLHEAGGVSLEFYLVSKRIQPTYIHTDIDMHACIHPVISLLY